MANPLKSAFRRALALLIGWIFLMVPVGCGESDSGDSPTAAPSDTPVSDDLSTRYFTALPMASDDIIYVTGLGHFAPPGHTVPTPHAYLYWRTGPSYTIRDVFAPATGTIESVISTGEGHKFWVRVSPKFQYIMDHVDLLPAYTTAGVTVTAGERVGTTNTAAYAIDLGAYHSDHANEFANPSRYSYMSLQARAPWVYFTDSLKATLDAKSFVVGADKNLTVNYDVSGTLRGTWFLTGVPETSDAETDPANWAKQLTFGLDEEDPSNSVMSVGGTVTSSGIYRAGTYDFQTVVPASGKVLLTTTLGMTTHYFLVQLTDAATLKIEHSLAPLADFSGGELTYLR